MIWLLTTVQQGLLFLATVLFVGCVSWRVMVAPGAHAILEHVDAGLGSTERSVVRWARTSVLVLALAWVLRMIVQVMAFRDPFAPLWDDVSLLLFQTVWGDVWMAQGLVVFALLGAFWIPGVRHLEQADSPGGLRVTPAWWAITIVAVALATTLSMSGHAMGAESWRTVAVAADVLHTLAAGGWIGTLAVILLSVHPADTNASSPIVFGAQIERFSPIALASAGTLVVMGAGLSWTHLTAVSDLWTTGYGRILGAKVMTVLLIIGLGFKNWQEGVPLSNTPEGVQAIRRRGAWEVGFAAVVILLTAILVHSTKP